MISVAITTYNRSHLIGGALVNIIDNPLVDEIVISDDASSDQEWKDLQQIVKKIEEQFNKKIKLIQNSTNMGGFWNKAIAVENCTPGSWVLLLDSDNVVLQNTIQLYKENIGDEKTILLPELAYPYFHYKNEIIMPGAVLTLAKIKQNIKEFSTLLNTGNFMFYRDFFIESLPKTEHIDCSASCSLYINYLFLKNNATLKIIPESAYFHSVHNGSYWLQNREKAMEAANIIYQKILAI